MRGEANNAANVVSARAATWNQNCDCILDFGTLPYNSPDFGFLELLNGFRHFFS